MTNKITSHGYIIEDYIIKSNTRIYEEQDYGKMIHSVLDKMYEFKNYAEKDEEWSIGKTNDEVQHHHMFFDYHDFEIWKYNMQNTIKLLLDNDILSYYKYKKIMKEAKSHTSNLGLGGSYVEEIYNYIDIIESIISSTKL